MKATTNTDIATILSRWTPALNGDLLPPTHPNGQRRMRPLRQCKSPLNGYDPHIFALAGETGADEQAGLVALDLS